MASGPNDSEPGGPYQARGRVGRRTGGVSRGTQWGLLAITLVVMVVALTLSSALVVYTAWLHDLKKGFFALIFAVLSAQMALNWFLWKDEAEEQDPSG